MRFHIWNRAAALLLVAALAGCVVGDFNPVTGHPIYAPVSASTEAKAGQKAHDELIANYGVYDKDPALTAYVDRVGQALAKNVVRKGVTYTFTILDKDEINAFALPGGFVFVTRGTLNYANSEAELAGIIGHEIGHVDAFHFGRASDHDTVRDVLSVLLRRPGATADERAVADELTDKKAASSARYSQDNEFEADLLGIHYMTLAGYDPNAMLAALRSEQAKSELDDAGMKGNPVAHDLYELDQSHPATPARIARAEDAVKRTVLPPGVTPKIERDAYLAAIDGMTFGADPSEGTVEGRRVVNAVMGYSFEAPEDFDLWTGRGGVFGAGPNSVLVLEATDTYEGQSLVSHVQSSMMEKMSVGNVRPLDLDGYKAATGVVMSDHFVVRLAAVHDRGKRLYQLLYITPRRVFNDLDAAFLDSLKTFRPSKAPEATPQPAPVIRTVTVKPGDTAKSLSERMAVKEKKLEWFRVLNGMAAGDEVKAGDKVKVVEVR